MSSELSDIATDNNNEGQIESTDVVATDNNNDKKRARGRPPGSKNKPKTPALVQPQSASDVVFSDHLLLHVEVGEDVVASLAAYSRSSNLAVCVLQASGIVTGFSLQYLLPNMPPITISSHCDLITLSGTIFPTPGTNISLTATVIDSNRCLVGGHVQGPLLAQTPVSVVVATFRPSNCYKLTPIPVRPQIVSGSGSGYVSGYFPNGSMQDRVTVASTGAAAQEPPYVWPGDSQITPPT